MRSLEVTHHCSREIALNAPCDDAGDGRRRNRAGFMDCGRSLNDSGRSGKIGGDCAGNRFSRGCIGGSARRLGAGPHESCDGWGRKETVFR